MIRVAASASLALLLAFAPAAPAGEPTITLTVDARELPRNLASSEMVIRLDDRMLDEERNLDLYFPIWVPGNHGPSGPIQNVAEIRISDCDGNPLHWDRDPTQWERITVAVPEGCDAIEFDMTYIASQPSVLSRSSDTYGKPNFAGLNWNTVVWYPGGLTHQEISVSPTLIYPGTWTRRPATSLRSIVTTNRRDDSFEVRFETVPLAELVDSPVVIGEHLQTVELDVGAGTPPHYFHTVASEPRYCTPPDWLIGQLEELVRQGQALFGPFPREQYHFQYLFGEGLRFGLEHGESTFMGGPQERLLNAEPVEGLRGGGASMLVIPHEYVHAWCGKLRAPRGMVRDDFHTPARTELLWVYEGLTSYYDEVLGTRSGMTTFEEFKNNILGAITTYQQRSGRLWRSVEDTARAAGALRDPGKFWYDIRRGQDYYGEGSLFWLEADAIIRRGTNGQKSLDDFCMMFFNVPAQPVGSQATYTRQDIVDALTSVYPGQDWDELIRQRIERPRDSLDMSYLLEKIGYTIEHANEPTELQKLLLKEEDDINLRTSIGVVLTPDGKVDSLVPDSPADRADIGYGMTVVGVNGWVFTPERMREAIANSTEKGRVELLVSFADRIEQRVIEYDAGTRHPRLVHVEGEPDILFDAAQPR